MSFRRALGPFDATMVVIGGIIGSGHLHQPVHRRPAAGHAPCWCSAAWVAGGAIALAGAFAYAELGALFPHAGGQYVYLRDGWHPLAGFLYGWALLLMIESGAIAAVAITFANYALRLVGRPDVAPVRIAIAAIVLLSIVNYLGREAGQPGAERVGGAEGRGAGGADRRRAAWRRRFPGWCRRRATGRRPSGIDDRWRSARRSCRSSSPTAAGRTPTTSPRRSRTRSGTCRSAC